MVAWDWLKDEEDTYVTENLMTTKEMWENDDTQPAFDDENKDHMGIQDDTHEAFGDPDDKDRKWGHKKIRLRSEVLTSC